jgi:hypothetical protein
MSKAEPKAKSVSRAGKTRKPTGDASLLIDQRIRDLAGWRGATPARMRALKQAAAAPGWVPGRPS